MKFRQHRGGLEDSMKTVEIFDGTKRSLCAILKRIYKGYGMRFNDKTVKVSYYDRDERIKWDSYIVEVGGYGVAGFTDGDVK